MTSGVVLDTIQDDQMLEGFIDGFIDARRGGIMGDRYLISNTRIIRYIDTNNIYCLAPMQKLPYKDFEFTTTPLDTILNTDDVSD